MKSPQLLTLCFLISLFASCDKDKDPEEVCILTSLKESDGRETVFGYESEDRVTKISVKKPDFSSTRTYTYNADGLVNTIFDDYQEGYDIKTTLHYSLRNALDSAIGVVVHDDGSTSLWARIVYHYRNGKISGYQINSDQDSVVWRTEFSDVDARGNYQQQKRFDLNDSNRLVRSWIFTYDDKPNAKGTHDHHFPYDANDLSNSNTTSQTQFSANGEVVWEKTSTFQYEGQLVKSASVSYQHKQSVNNKNYKVEYGYTCREVD